MTWVQAVFLLLALVALGSALLVVSTRNMVHAALWLVVTLGAVAGIYLVLAAEFLAWVQILIYVGAVVVLLLFALMLTRAPTGPQPDLDGRRIIPAAVVAGLVAALLVTTVVAGFRDVDLSLGDAVVGSAQITGSTIFEKWVLPFEVLSVLLLAALIGAIVLSRGETTDPLDDDPLKTAEPLGADGAPAGARLEDAQLEDTQPRGER